MNNKKINWPWHIFLMFCGGLGFVTMFIAMEQAGYLEEHKPMSDKDNSPKFSRTTTNQNKTTL